MQSSGKSAFLCCLDFCGLLMSYFLPTSHPGHSVTHGWLTSALGGPGWREAHAKLPDKDLQLQVRLALLNSTEMLLLTEFQYTDC